MITETMAIEGLYVLSLALTSTEKWQAAGSSLKTGLRAEGLFIGFAVFALVVTEILLFYVFSKNKRSEEHLNQKINDLTVTNVKLRQEKEKTDEEIEKLKNENTELAVTNEKLRKESAQLTKTT